MKMENTSSSNSMATWGRHSTKLV